MTFTRNNLPQSFTPYEKLTICSNVLLGGGHLVEISNTLPLIIGTGEKPQVWIQAISDPNSMQFVSVVENSVSKFPMIKIMEVDSYLVITMQKETILKIKKISSTEAVIDYLNLAPMGLNLSGDSNGLKIPNGQFSGNTMSGNGVLLGLSG